MKVICEGNMNRFYVQTLCMLFFPGAKFAENEEVGEETPVVRVKAEEDESGVHAEASITIGSQHTESAHTEPYRSDVSHARTSKIAIGIAFFRAGEQFFGYTPSWGILTGVRPGKIATEMLHAGCDYETIRRRLTEEYFLNPKKALICADVAINEDAVISRLPERSCSLYISIPFCPTRCAYCSFVSYSTPRLLSLIPDYLERLMADIDRTLEVISELGLRVVTVYIGGGTPTTLTADQLRILLDRIGQRLDRTYLREFTLEAGRPDTVTPEKLSVAAQGGVTRVSINPQTLNDEVLRAIGRRHTAEEFFRAFSMARESGIQYINTDMIAGLPGEDFNSFSHGLDTILRLSPDNLTVHTFCVKKAADILRSGREVYSRTGGDTGKSIDYSQFRAKMMGYQPYYMYRQKNSVGNFENVGFAKPGAEGLYNIFIMEEVHSVFAVGAGAVTKLVPGGGGPLKRLFMPKYPYEYLAMNPQKEMDDFFAQVHAFYREM